MKNHEKTSNLINVFRRKVLCLVLAVVLACGTAAMMTGCGSAQTNAETAEVVADSEADDTSESTEDMAAPSSSDTSGESATDSPDALDGAEVGDTVPMDTAETPGTDEFVAKLEAIDGICDVTKDESGSIQAYIEQPLDWQSDTGKTFKQLFTIRYAGDDQPVCYCVGGYNIATSASDLMMFPDGYSYNAVRIEYRYYGESRPEGLSNDSTDMWEYLTLENAAEDFHALISKLDTIFTGKSVMTGVSKGGYTTNYQACKHPEDADLYISFCAPLNESTADTRVYDFINNRIGDDVIGEEKASELRELILDFTVECIRYKDDLKLAYKKKAIEENGEENYRSWAMEDDGGKLYDAVIADMQGAIWLDMGGVSEWSTPDGLKNSFESIISMPASTQEEIKAKEEAILNVICSICDPSGYSCSEDAFMYTYVVQSMMQIGNYAVDLTPLRERIAEEQEKDASFPDLSITKEEEASVFLNIYLTDEFKEMASKFTVVHDELIEWEETTKAQVIMVFGAADPWYATAIPECDNENITRIVVKSSDLCPMVGHSGAVSIYDEDSQKIIYDALEKLK